MHQFSNHEAVDATTRRLHGVVEECSACHQSLDGHSYRFFSCHPADKAFKAAIDTGDWATVHAMQTPSVGQPSFVVYAIACPGQIGGMVAVLHSEPEADSTDLLRKQPLSAGDFAALRALCPTCQWVAFS